MIEHKTVGAKRGIQVDPDRVGVVVNDSQGKVARVRWWGNKSAVVIPVSRLKKV